MKKVLTLTVCALFLGLALILAGCGSSSSGGGFANVDVQYTVTGDKISHNANESRDFRDPLVGTDFRELTWFCGNYKGDQKKKVVLTFKNSNNTWILDKENVTGGNCG